MLVLTRRQGESLRIDENIRITMVSCSAGQVRIAIDAPDSIEILREEVYDRIASANLAAASSPDATGQKMVNRVRPRATGGAFGGAGPISPSTAKQGTPRASNNQTKSHRKNNSKN
ncbi:MAG: carbon storage regulator [Myxococcota bacterium]|jgi:carbon storage regulator